jgi:hypothetical protein
VLLLGEAPHRQRLLTFLSLRKDLVERCPDAEYFDLRFRGRIYAKQAPPSPALPAPAPAARAAAPHAASSASNDRAAPASFPSATTAAPPTTTGAAAEPPRDDQGR